MKYLDKLFESIEKDGLTEEEQGIEYNTPFSFLDYEDEELPAEMKNTKFPFEESFSKIRLEIDKLNEISYKAFKSDNTNTVKQKLNNSITEINKGLSRAEKLISHALKLKTEVGADQSIFFKDTFRKFSIIGERMNRLQNKIREFSK